MPQKLVLENSNHFIVSLDSVLWKFIRGTAVLARPSDGKAWMVTPMSDASAGMAEGWAQLWLSSCVPTCVLFKWWFCDSWTFMEVQDSECKCHWWSCIGLLWLSPRSHIVSFHCTALVKAVTTYAAPRGADIKPTSCREEGQGIWGCVLKASQYCHGHACRLYGGGRFFESLLFTGDPHKSAWYAVMFDK